MATGSNVSKAIVPITFLLTLGFVGAGAVMLVLTTQSARDDQSFLGATHEQSALAQSIAKDAAAAQAGEREAFNGLQRARDRMNNLVDQVTSATSSGTAAQVSSQVSIVRDAWDATTPAIQTIFDSRDTIRVAHRAAQNLELSMPPLLSKVEEIQEALADGDSPRAQSYQVGLFTTLARRAQRDIKVLLTGAGDMEAAAEQLDEAEGYMDRVLRGLASGDPGIDLPAVTDSATLALVREAQTLYQTVGEDLRAISSAAEILEEVDVARRQLGAQSAILAEEARILRQGYEGAIGNRLIKPEYAYGALGLSLISLIALVVFWYLSADVRRAAEIQEEMQTKNQEAILRLLDELGSLADGDLTVQVTVTEDITGAIADSINYAIEALRELVVTINDTAIQVNSAAQQTRSITSHLAQASENQAKQITSATQQINTMATSIEQVSANAERSAKVAQQSVDIAHKGGEAVRRTITGMNTIRETIQETSKRIKRLGESSQEIGDIVELINDIAEQTNILALNASIQASMAGEAGRGFAVVADEVQRLAERAGNATRQIEALVKTIQSDTNEAVSSMERSTSDVVQGAQLAENAGRALDEIEKVSNHIATLVQSISNSARQQAGQAADVSQTMNVIQEITEQTAEGTQQTASSVGELVSLAAELRKSVAGFKLPGDGGQAREPQAAQAQAPEEESELPAEAQA